MKKTGICILSGAVIAILGAGLFTYTTLRGATGYHSDWLNVGFSPYDEWQIADSIEEAPSAEYAVSSLEPEPARIKSWDGCRYLSVELDNAELELVEGDDWEVALSGISEDELGFYEDGDHTTLSVYSYSDGSATRTVTMTIPSYLQEVTVNAGFGSISIRDLKIDTLTAYNIGNILLEDVQSESCDLSCDSGDITLTDTTAAWLNAQTDAGSIDIQNSAFQSTTLSADTGNIRFSGNPGDFSFYTDTGSVDLSIDGTRDDYLISAETSVGSITAFGVRINGTDASFGSDNARYSGSIETDIGNITISDE